MPSALAADPAPRVLAQQARVPLSVYVHLPWCVRKCPYCDFNSHRAPAELPEQTYVDALLADWAATDTDDRRPIETVFFGGGTPSLFSGSAIGRILTALDARRGLTGDCEITLEANPGTTERTRFADLRTAGVNRLSLGVQSLDDTALQALGRVHDAHAAGAAVADARAAGFDSINVDLMFGLPDHDLDRALADLEAVLALSPDHLSFYQLTLEPNTPFYRRPPSLPDPDTVADIFAAGRDRLTGAGFEQYEVSAWAGRRGRCRHNDNYWRFGDYLGIGAGAHGKYTRADGSIERTARLRWPTGYMQAAGTPRSIAERRELDADDARFEYLLNGLRRRDGIDATDYVDRTGLAWRELGQRLAVPIADGLVDFDDRRLCATDRGWRFLDTILESAL